MSVLSLRLEGFFFVFTVLFLLRACGEGRVDGFSGYFFWGWSGNYRVEKVR